MPNKKKDEKGRTPPVAGRLGLVTLHVDRFKDALGFYRDALGLPVLELIDQDGLRWAEFDVGGLRLGVHADPERAEPGARSPGGASGLYFTVPDVDAAIQTLRARGVKIVDEPADKPYGRDAAVADPDGNVLCLVKPL